MSKTVKFLPAASTVRNACTPLALHVMSLTMSSQNHCRLSVAVCITLVAWKLKQMSCACPIHVGSWGVEEVPVRNITMNLAAGTNCVLSQCEYRW